MKLMMPIADGFEEIEAFSVLSVLRGAGIEVDMIGVVGINIESAHSVKVMADKRLDEVNTGNYDGIVIPGGGPSCETLLKSQKILDVVRNFTSSGKLVAAICFAPLILEKAGVLKNRKATIYPGLEKKIPYPRGDRVVIDGNIITSQGPGTSLEFAISIVRYLLGEDKAKKVLSGLVI